MCLCLFLYQVHLRFCFIIFSNWLGTNWSQLFCPVWRIYFSSPGSHPPDKWWNGGQNAVLKGRLIVYFSYTKTSSSLSLNRKGGFGTSDDFTTSFLHCSMFSTVLWDLANSRLVHFLMLSFHHFLCLPCLLSPFTVPCKIVMARPDEQETWPYHCSLHLFTLVRRSSCGLIACWILAWTSSLVHGLCMRCVVSCGNISFPWLVFFFGALLLPHLQASSVFIGSGS